MSRDLDDTSAISRADVSDAVPDIPQAMAEELKFAAALPPAEAVQVLAERFTDRLGAGDVTRQRPVQVQGGGRP